LTKESENGISEEMPYEEENVGEDTSESLREPVSARTVA
jgi:hypothetical protein